MFFLKVLPLFMVKTTPANCSQEVSNRRLSCARHAPPCGLFNLGTRMHSEMEGTMQCTEMCTYFSRVRFMFGYKCGACVDTESTTSPVPTTLRECESSCFFGLLTKMHQEVEGSDICQEICTFGPLAPAGYLCGPCMSQSALSPSSSPIRLETPSSNSVSIRGNRLNITLDLSGVPKERKNIFSEAVLKWESVIVSELSPVAKEELDENPPDGCSYPELVDDLHICAKYGEIDGSGRILAFARPLFLRGEVGDLGLPVIGEIVIDVQDASIGIMADTLENVVKHEMGHVGSAIDLQLRRLTSFGRVFVIAEGIR